MTGAQVLDIVLLLVLGAYAVGMYRTGLVAGALSLAGLLGGGLLALWFLPGVLQDRPLVEGNPVAQGALLLGGVVLAAALGQTLGAHVGDGVRSRVRFRPARVVDSLLGGVVGLLVAASLVWFAAGALAAHPTPLSDTIRGSRVLQGIDQSMPAGADRFLAQTRRTLDANGFPRVFSGLQTEPIRPVEQPAQGVASGQGVQAAADSVVKVTGWADGCGRGQQGSGWVAAHERVVTNAHVLAGVDSPSVQIGGTGTTYPATTVAFDPLRDIAVLAVPGLPADPLPTGSRLAHGDSIVIAGFPLGGPYDLEAGRVRDLLEARGHGIDGSAGVNREVYSFSGRVEQGNSGGPLLSPQGEVVGTVFAKSESGPPTGYALTLAETRPVVAEAAGATQEVSTGSCTP